LTLPQRTQRELTDLMPSVLNQLGPDTMASLRKIAEQYQAQNAAQGGAALPTGIEDVESGDNGEEIPELVEAAEVRLESSSSWTVVSFSLFERG
jgi:nascent polypeptide-associated complex subunit beta